jgi:hypothetical protein
MSIGNSQSIPDPLELLHADERTAVFESVLDDSLCDNVVLVGDAPSLPSRKTFQNALGVLRSFGLEGRTDSPTFLTVLANRFTVKFKPETGDGDVADSEVHAEHSSGCGIGNLGLNDDVNEVTVLGADKRCGLALGSGGESLALIVSDIELSPLSSSVGRVANFVLLEDQSDGVPIETNKGWAVLELALEFCGLKVARHSPESGYDEIGRESVVRLNLPIECVVKSDCVRFPVVSSPLSDLGAGVGIAGKELTENGKIGFWNNELAPDCAGYLHGGIIL